MGILKKLFRSNSEKNDELGDNVTEQLNERSFTFADVKGQLRDNIGCVSSIDEMEERRHDLEFQLAICRPMIEAGELLPFPFHRAVILLSKEKRYEEAIEICLYVEKWCKIAEMEFDGVGAMHWKSSKLGDIIARIPKLRTKLNK